MTLTLDQTTEIPAAFDTKAPASTCSTAQAIEAACVRVPPLWPLQNFVAVNPFVGLSNTPFVAACALLQRTAHAQLQMPVTHYQQQWQDGIITEHDVQNALDQTLSYDFDVDALKSALHNGWNLDENAAILTVAETLDGSLDTMWQAFMRDEISKWCSAYYDRGQASWRMPWRGQELFAAWKEAASLDANPEMGGLKNFRHCVQSLPAEPHELIEKALEILQIPQAGATDFLHRELLAMAGWSGYVQYQVRENGLYGREDDSLSQLLAILLAYEIALYQQHEDTQFRSAWTQNLARLSEENSAPTTTPAQLWQLAAENAYQRQLLAKLAAHEGQTSLARPAVQAVFCIDVRSELLRRALETVYAANRNGRFRGILWFSHRMDTVWPRTRRGAMSGSADARVPHSPIAHRRHATANSKRPRAAVGRAARGPCVERVQNLGSVVLRFRRNRRNFGGRQAGQRFFGLEASRTRGHNGAVSGRARRQRHELGSANQSRDRCADQYGF